MRPSISYGNPLPTTQPDIKVLAPGLVSAAWDTFVAKCKLQISDGKDYGLRCKCEVGAACDSRLRVSFELLHMDDIHAQSSSTYRLCVSDESHPTLCLPDMAQMVNEVAARCEACLGHTNDPRVDRTRMKNALVPSKTPHALRCLPSVLRPVVGAASLSSHPLALMGPEP